MENPRIYESLCLLNDKVLGLLARMDYLQQELDNEKSEIKFLQHQSISHLAKQSSKKMPTEIDPRTLSDLYEAGTTKQDMLSLLRPHLETLLEVMDVTPAVIGLFATMAETRIHLDLSTNTTLTTLSLKLVANLASLLFILSGVKASTTIAVLYKSISDHIYQGQENLVEFLSSYSSPVRKLTVDFANQTILVNAVLSVKKVLLGTSEKVTGLLLYMLQSAQSVVTPDELDTRPLGVHDIICPEDLVKWTFICFIVTDTPWKTGKEEDSGGALIRNILTKGMVISLHRQHFLYTHAVLQDIYKRRKAKDSRAKIRAIKEWENLAGTNASKEHKKRRQELSILVEQYTRLLEEKPSLLVAKIFKALTILTLCTSEIKWLVMHQNNTKHAKKKDDNLLTDQETLTLLYYITKLQKLVLHNTLGTSEIWMEYIRRHDAVGLRDTLSLVDHTKENQEMVQKMLEELDQSNIQVVDIGRVSASLSVQADQSSSPMQKLPALASQLELMLFHATLAHHPGYIVNQVADLSLSYFFRDTFEDYFKWLMTIPQKLSYAITFPIICEDLVCSLHNKCPEEYSKVTQELSEMVHYFLDTIATTATKHIESYCSEYIKMSKAIAPESVASQFSSKKQKAKAKKEGNREGEGLGEGEENLKAQKSRHSRKVVEETQIAIGEESRRINLFETEIEKLSIGLYEILKAVFYTPSIRIAANVFYPSAYLLEKLSDQFAKTVEKIIQFPSTPLQVLNKLTYYLDHITNIDIRMRMDLLLVMKETLAEVRSGESAVFQKYIQKYTEEVLSAISSHSCYYNPIYKCFMAINTKGEKQDTNVEILTSVQEIQALVSLFGVTGCEWLVSELAASINPSLTTIIHCARTNSAAICSIKPSQFDDNIWQRLRSVPEFVEASVDVGKKLALIQLIEEGVQSVTEERVFFFYGIVQDIFRGDIANALGVPETVVDLVAAMGNTDATLSKTMGKDIKLERDDVQLILNMFASTVPLLSRLQTSRFLIQSTPPHSIPLDLHQNSIHCIAITVEKITPILRKLQDSQFGPAETPQDLSNYEKILVTNLLRLPLDSKAKNRAGAMILGHHLLGEDHHLSGKDFQLPYSLVRASIYQAATHHGKELQENMSLKVELNSKKITKMFSSEN